MSLSFISKGRRAIVAVALLAAAAGGLEAQTPASAQDRLWDAAIAGDTVALGQAITDGAQVDSLDVRRNQNGRRALNWAAWHNHAAAIRFLVAHGAKVNLANRTGFTPLHHAAENGSADAAAALLTAGADPALVNAGSQTPADVAREREQPAIAAKIDSAAASR